MNYTINEFIDNYEKNSDQFYGFYDWFCSEKSLKNRAKSFVPKLKFLVKEGLIDGDKVYVWFKNNCPMVGTLYDDMRFSVIDTGKYLGGVAPRSGHDAANGKCNIWAIDDDKLIQDNFTSWSEFKRVIKTNKDLRNKYKKLWRAE